MIALFFEVVRRAGAVGRCGARRLRACEIERGHGMYAPAQAPQFYPPLEKRS